MKVEANIDESSIEGIVKDVIIKRLSNEMYNKNFQGFVHSKSPDICTKANVEMKSRVNKLVSDRIDKWINSNGENLEQYIDRRLQETVENIDFTNIIKEKYIR